MQRPVAALCLCFFAGRLFAADGLGLLERMSDAMDSSSYSGIFVYRHKDKVETLKILHRHNKDGVNERLVTLTGKPREFIRDNAVVTCILPEKHLVLIDKGRSESRFPGIVPSNLNRLLDSYSLKVRHGSERIAGRPTYVVDVIPKDGYRYGYRLWIDRDWYLLVRSDLLDKDRHPIEQVMFTELQLRDHIPDKLFEPRYLREGFRWREMGEVSVSDNDKQAQWKAGALPPGFFLQTHSRRVKPPTGKPVEHIVFSDGMASVSVFIENGHNDKLVEGSVRRGALNVYGRERDDHHITVMGEVPGPTVKLIAESIKLTHQ